MSESARTHEGDTPEPENGGHSRRRFMVGAGAGLAITAAGVAAAGTASADSTADTAAAQTAGPVTAGTTAGPPIIAYVSDSRRDRVSIQRGTTEVVVRDPALVKALNKALARRATTKES